MMDLWETQSSSSTKNIPLVYAFGECLNKLNFLKYLAFKQSYFTYLGLERIMTGLYPRLVK